MRPATSPTGSSRNSSATAPPILHLVRSRRERIRTVDRCHRPAVPRRQAARRMARARAPRRALGRRRRRRAARPRRVPDRRADDQLRADRRPAGARGGAREARRGRVRLAHGHERHHRRRALVVRRRDPRDDEGRSGRRDHRCRARRRRVPRRHRAVRGQLGPRPARGVGGGHRRAGRPARARPALGDRQAGALDRPRPGRATTSRRSSPTARSACPWRRRSSTTCAPAGSTPCS